MNKYKEAFAILTDWFHSYTDHNGVRVHERHITENYKEAKQTIQELVEKATPKKLIDMSKEPHDTVGACPNCNKWCYMDYHSEYCGECGQALDWSEEE